MLRTHNCGELSLKNVDEQIKLSAWVVNKRELGPMVFVMLGDRYGKTQVVFEGDLLEKAQKLSLEDVISIEGKVVDRKENRTDKYSTGDIEVLATNLEILSKSKPLPFDYRKDASDIIKLKYRYIDIRKSGILKNIEQRAKVTSIVRNYLDSRSFLDVETPILNKSTPEGARDFLVPSRISKGSFYALPQSPQIFKQLLMVSGIDRYYQITKCFRDEDLRADRQPEFTQIDIEMSFVEEKDVMDLAEGMVKEVFKKIKNIELPDFPKITYNEAMDKYGSDAPDLRFGMELQTLDEIFKNSEFNAFNNASNSEEMIIKAIILENHADDFSRNALKKIEKEVKGDGAKALATISKQNNELNSPILKFLNDSEKEAFEKMLNNNDIAFIVADEKSVALTALGNLRKRFALKYELYTKDDFAPLWVVDFPAFEYDKEEDRWVTPHHPFTDFDFEALKNGTPKGEISSRAYDIVLNGHEIGGGSIRIHNLEKQKEVFKLLNISQEEAQEKFGFLLEAFSFGAPPHGGLAFGLDRLMMILLGTEAIRDVIAFPKTTSASCLMSQAPSEVALSQLKELGIEIKNN